MTVEHDPHPPVHVGADSAADATVGEDDVQRAAECVYAHEMLLRWARQAHTPDWIDAADLTLHAALAAHTAALAARRTR